jgi:hypothetical protein
MHGTLLERLAYMQLVQAFPVIMETEGSFSSEKNVTEPYLEVTF